MPAVLLVSVLLLFSYYLSSSSFAIVHESYGRKGGKHVVDGHGMREQEMDPPALNSEQVSLVTSSNAWFMKKRSFPSLSSFLSFRP